MAETDREKSRMRSVPETQGLGSGLSCPDAFRGGWEVLFSLDKADTRCEGRISNIWVRNLFFFPGIYFYCLPLQYLSHSWVQMPWVFKLFVPICLKKLQTQKLHLWLSWPPQPQSFIVSNPSLTFALGQTSAQTSASLGWSLASWTSCNRIQTDCLLPDSQDDTQTLLMPIGFSPFTVPSYPKEHTLCSHPI